MKFYFKDRNGREIETKLQGIPFNWCGPALATNGVDMCEPEASEKWTDSKGRFARTELEGYSWVNDKRETFPIDITCFPGHSAVIVKHWSPDSADTYEFWLVGEDAREKIAKSTCKVG